MKKILSISILVIVSCSSIRAQYDYKKIVPISPTASSLGRYGDVPVSFYTGTPNISIPLAILKGTELELPVSLSYMARGVKVEDNGSWVGVNWSLNAGGVITRTVRGLVDDGTRPLVSFPLPTDLTALKDVMTNIQEKAVDPEPDLYFFNFSGHSGSFVMDKDGVATFENYGDLKVIANATRSVFTIISEDGTQYIFNDTWETSDGTTTAINLSQIISPTGKEQINFQYASERFQYYGTKRFTRWIRPNGTSSYMLHPISDNGAIFPLHTIDARRLTGITTNFNQNVEFIPETTKRADFADLPSDPGPRMLNRIRLYDRFNVSTKSFKFSYDVVESTLPYVQQDQVVDPTALAVAYLNRRIYLKSVQETSDDLTQVIPPHVFTYFGRTNENKDLLPNRLSSAQDYWGYYNGYDNNLSLWMGYNGPFGTYDLDFPLPPLQCYTGSVNPEYISTPSFVAAGANRNVRFPYCLYGTLASITYPTGGHTEFEFETQRYLYEATKGKYITKPQLVSASVSVYGGSQILEDIDAIQTSLNATLEFEISVTCWDPNDHHSMPCGSPGSAVNLEKYRGNSVSIINSEGTEVYAVKSLPGDGGFWFYDHGQVDTSIGMLQPDASGYIRRNATSQALELMLQAGSFTLKAKKDPNSDTDVLGWLYYTEQVPVNINDPSEAKDIGGLRIKRIENFDSNNSSTGKKTYQYGAGVTQAELRNAYMYIPFSTPRLIQFCNPDLDLEASNRYGEGSSGLPDIYPYLQVECGPSVELGYTQGSTVGYTTVTETQTGNGSTVYHYTTALDYPENFITTLSLFANGVIDVTKQDIPFPSRIAWPYVKSDNYEWRRGILKEVIYRDNSGNTLVDRKMTPALVDKKTVGGLRLQTIKNDKLWQYSTYYYSSGTMNINSTLETQFNNLERLEKATTNFYESTHHNFLTKTTVSTSTGTLSTEFHYPDDYENITDPGHVISKLKSANLHIVGVPIETRTYRNGTLVGGSANPYALFSKTGGGLFAAPGFSYSLKQDLAIPNFGWSSDPTNPDTTYFVKDLTLAYDGVGNVIKYQTRDQVETSFLWESYNQFPVAKVMNATPAEIFHSSFELNGVAEDVNNPAKTGQKYWNSNSFNFSANGSFSPSNSSELKMSYWYWSSGQWKFSGELPFQNSFISSGSRLDEVRVYPADAQMNTYTYAPFRGITSATDANNITTYYKYDGFGRLKNTKDNDKNITQDIRYHYKTQN